MKIMKIKYLVHHLLQQLKGSPTACPSHMHSWVHMVIIIIVTIINIIIA